jgi:hypothetical protein
MVGLETLEVSAWFGPWGFGCSHAQLVRSGGRAEGWLNQLGDLYGPV